MIATTEHQDVTAGRHRPPPTNGAAGLASACKAADSELGSRQFPAVLPRTSTRPSAPRPSPPQGSTSRPASGASSSSDFSRYAGLDPSPQLCAAHPNPALGNPTLPAPEPSTARQNLHGSPTNETLLTIPPPHRRTGTQPANATAPCNHRRTAYRQPARPSALTITRLTSIGKAEGQDARATPGCPAEARSSRPQRNLGTRGSAPR